MALLTKELAHSALKENIAYLIGPAPLVSALDMKGFSLTLLKLNDYFEKAIHAEVETLGWQKPVAFALCVPFRKALFTIAWNMPRPTIRR